MSSIPNAKMKHAHAAESAPADQDRPAPKAKTPKPKKADGATITGRAKELAEDAADAVRARPKTAAAIGAALVAGAAALVGGPALAAKLTGDEPAKPKPAKKPKKA